MDSKRVTGKPQIAIDMRMMYHSGIGTYLRNLIPRLIASRPQTLFHLLGNVEHLSTHEWARHPNVVLHDCRSAIYSAIEQLEIPLKIPAGVDLFWSPHYNIPLLYRGPLVVTVHDLCHVAMPDLVSGVHKRLYARLMFAALRRKACAILCDSDFTARELVRLTGCAPERVHIVHLGVSERWFHCQKKGNPHGRPFGVYVGSVKPHKNLPALMAAFKLLADRIPYDLVVIGKKEGLITADEQAAAAASSLEGRVHSVGHLEDGMLEQYYLHADFMAFPSLYEGFGLPPLEAMACGCPVIVSDAASLPEVCGDAALYCDPRSPADIAAKITLLTENAALRDDLRRKGLERARLFTWENTTRRTLEVLDRVMCR